MPIANCFETRTMTITDHDDLLIEILLCLPAKSLIRFKLVCKNWFYIISGRHFATRHTLHHRRPSKPDPSFLLRLADTWDYFYLQFGNLYGGKFVSYPFPPTLIEPTILSVSNGLFLLQCRNVLDPLEASCHIYNPTTKQYRKILLNRNERYKCLMGLNLAFDPLVSPHYKIICIMSARRRSSGLLRGWWRRCQVEVYESETCTWKICGEPFVASRDMDFNRGIFWKGGIHWRGIFFNFLDSCIGKHPEVFEVPRGEKFSDNYVESNGSLHYIVHFIEKGLVMVFELQSDYSRWILKYDHINIDKAFSMLSIVRGDGEEDGMFLLHEKGKLMAYMFQEKSVKELVDFKEEPFYKEHFSQFDSRCTFQFIETLAPV